MMKTQASVLLIQLLGLVLLLIPGRALVAQDTLQMDPRPIFDKDSVHIEDLIIDGEIVQVIIEGDDTLLLSTFDEISVTSKRFFASNEEYRRYLIYRKYAQDVYPFA